MRRSLPLLGALGALAFVFLPSSACREPTEMDVHVTTDFDCSALAQNTVTVRLGAAFTTQGSATSVSTACANRNVGTVVVTPSGRGDRVTIEVMAALAPATLDADGACVEGSAGCIRSRRSLVFIPHSPISLPISLQSSCAGHSCDPGNTCVDAQCVSNVVDSNRCVSGDCNLHGDGGVVLAAPCADTTSLQAGAPRPMSNVCPARANVAPVDGPLTMPTREDRLTTNGPPAQVVIDRDNVAYVSTYAGWLYAIALDTATQKWKVQLQATPLVSASGGLVLAANGVLYATNDSQVMPLSTADGSLLSPAVTAGKDVRSGLNMGPQGRLYFADGIHDIESMVTSPSLAASTSAVLTNAVDGIVPALFAGTLWAADGVGQIWAIDPSAMTHGNAINLGIPGGLAPLVGGPDGKLHALWGSGGGVFTVAAVDPTTHVLSWNQALPTKPTIAEIVGVTPDGATWIRDDNHTLYTYDVTGKAGKTWGATPDWPAFDAGGRVFATDDATGHLCARDAAGNSVWSSTYVNPSGVVAIGKNHTLLVVDDGEVRVYRP